jgi:predicted GTPase
METITIDVPSDVAIAYRNATPTEQEQIINRVALIVRLNVNKESALNRLWQTMDDIAEKAAERGLTPEILETLLEKN